MIRRTRAAVGCNAIRDRRIIASGATRRRTEIRSSLFAPDSVLDLLPSIARSARPPNFDQAEPKYPLRPFAPRPSRLSEARHSNRDVVDRLGACGKRPHVGKNRVHQRSRRRRRVIEQAGRQAFVANSFPAGLRDSVTPSVDITASPARIETAASNVALMAPRTVPPPASGRTPSSTAAPADCGRRLRKRRPSADKTALRA
jgi:hypothetical protein